MDIWDLDKTLLSIKTHYFLINGAVSGVIPILSLYARDLGITYTFVAFVFTLVKMLALAMRFTVAAITDKYKIYKLVLFVSIAITVIACLGLMFIPKHVSDLQCSSSKDSKNIVLNYHKCKFTCTALPNVGLNILCLTSKAANRTLLKFQVHFPNYDSCKFQGTYSCEKEVCNDDSISLCVAVNIGLQQTLFAVFVMFGIWFYMVATTLSDFACCNALKEEIYRFGFQRLFGSLGWGIFAAVSLGINSLYSTEMESNYASGFYIMLILLLVDLFVIFKLDMSNTEKSSDMLQDVSSVTGKPRTLVFLFGVIVSGSLQGFTWGYLFLYLQLLGGNSLLYGLVATTQCVAEIPCFMLAERILEKIGPMNTISIAYVVFALRFFGYFLLSNPWWILLVEPLHGLCFATYITAITSYAKIIAPKGTEATMQGLVGGMFDGIGVGLGGLIGGVAFTRSSSQNCFLGASMIALFAGLLHAGAHKLVDAYVGKSDTISTKSEQQPTETVRPNDQDASL